MRAKPEPGTVRQTKRRSMKFAQKLRSRVCSSLRACRKLSFLTITARPPTKMASFDARAYGSSVAFDALVPRDICWIENPAAQQALLVCRRCAKTSRAHRAHRRRGVWPLAASAQWPGLRVKGLAARHLVKPGFSRALSRADVRNRVRLMGPTPPAWHTWLLGVDCCEQLLHGARRRGAERLI
jgi:hypothetical protein